MFELNHRHGGPYDRGGADSYYGRQRRPHYYVGATYSTPRVDAVEMTEEQVAEYNRGFDDNEAACFFKNY